VSGAPRKIFGEHMSAEKTFWSLLRGHLPKKSHVQRIETGSTGRGIPDVNFCWQGVEVWIELKIVKGRRVELSPEQVAWMFRRARAGGLCWVMARDVADGPRKGKYDRIYLWPGDCAAKVLEEGLAAEGATVFERPYDWPSIMETLLDSRREGFIEGAEG
jgi:hypothetical protein